MKYSIPEISWHNRDPVLSVDFQPRSNHNDPLRLATGGTDTHVLIWYLSESDTGGINLEVVADLPRHQKAVNVVRWSPNGEYLASGDDESVIFVWKQRTDKDPPPIFDTNDEQSKETWIVLKTLRGHMEDVLDISWNIESTQLISGSIDNKMICWDVSKGRYTSIIADHKGFVQGVSWDPKNQLLASMSTDRVFRTFDASTKKVLSRSSKAVLPFPSDHPLHNQKVRLFYDDTLQTYFRRLQFSPDGMLIAVPSGHIEPEQSTSGLKTKPMNVVYIYTRFSRKIPACILPCGDAPALSVRWSPVVYRPREGGPAPAFPTPARMVLAVATRTSILIYDTQQRTPIALVSNIHYTRLTDVTWSSDGRVLVASSTDGFCSVIVFAEGELGEPLPAVANAISPDTNKPLIEAAESEEPEKETVKRENRVNKIESFVRFKTPNKNDSSPSLGQKSGTSVPMDIIDEPAMQSWSDNSNLEVKPKTSISETIILEDSEDIKLVYDESQTTKAKVALAPNTDLKIEIQNQAKDTTDMDKKIETFFKSKVAEIQPKKRVALVTLSSQAPKKNSMTTPENNKHKKIESFFSPKNKETKTNSDKKVAEAQRNNPETTEKTKDNILPNTQRNSVSNQINSTEKNDNAVETPKNVDITTDSPKIKKRVNFVTLSSPKTLNTSEKSVKFNTDLSSVSESPKARKKVSFVTLSSPKTPENKEKDKATQSSKQNNFPVTPKARKLVNFNIESSPNANISGSQRASTENEESVLIHDESDEVPSKEETPMDVE